MAADPGLKGRNSTAQPKRSAGLGQVRSHLEKAQRAVTFFERRSDGPLGLDIATMGSIPRAALRWAVELRAVGPEDRFDSNRNTPPRQALI